MRRFLVISVVVSLVLAGLGAFLWSSSQAGFYRFPGLRGPAGKSVVSTLPRATIAEFDHGGDHRLAVLVTDPNSGWLGLARGLKAHGIPFTLTTNVDRALRHKVVLVYPMISGRTLRAADFPALARHVHQGGYLLAFDVEGGGLQSLFGVAGAPRPTPANVLVWPTASPVLQERETRISRTGTEAAEGALAYAATTGQVLAHYETDEAGLICHRSVGRSCVLGVDLGALSERAMNGRGEAIARSYVNGYEPSLDTLYEWLAAFYVEGEPMPWLIDTAPWGRDLTILLTHDIDFTKAVGSARRSADALRADSANATFFMQTKYVRDYNDDVFFRTESLPDLKAILADGMEIGSHSVAHARTFKAFPFGDGAETYPDYRPFVESRTRARGGTVLGELRVSKFLLDHLVGGPVTSFRAGHLSDPFRLPDALAATGYRYDSSITANASLTHLPFQLTQGRADDALEPAYEFPVTIEDEAVPFLSKRVDAANAVIANIARHHGVAVILMHPDPAGQKLAFEQRLVAAWRGKAWFASMREFGDWWRARDSLEIDVVDGSSGWTLDIPPGHPRDLAVRLPKAASVAGAAGLTFRAADHTLDLGAPRNAGHLDVR